MPSYPGRWLRHRCTRQRVESVIRSDTLPGLPTRSSKPSALASCSTEVIIADLETCDFRDLGEFDCVICSHVLEHLRNPADVLARLR